MEPLAQHEQKRQVQVQEQDLEDRIRNLFVVSADSNFEEKKLEAMTNELAHAFLTAVHTNSEIGLAELAERFRNTEIPVYPNDVHEYLNSLARDIVAHSVRTSSPRFIGHMTSALPYF